jgi:hypothetical protein
MSGSGYYISNRTELGKNMQRQGRAVQAQDLVEAPVQVDPALAGAAGSAALPCALF